MKKEKARETFKNYMYFFISSELVKPHSEGQNPVATNSLTAADCVHTYK